MREFVQMSTVIPEGKSNDMEIQHFTMTKEQVKMAHLRALMSYDYKAYTAYLQPDYTYTKLVDSRYVWMSDTPMEQVTNREFLNRANGPVLIFGLGIGLIVYPLLQDETIPAVTVVENNEDVISLVGSHLAHPKLTIVKGDAFSADLGKEKFDTIYFDIWPDRSGKNYPQMGELHKKYRKNLRRDNPYRYINSWMRKEMKNSYYRNWRD